MQHGCAVGATRQADGAAIQAPQTMARRLIPGDRRRAFFCQATGASTQGRYPMLETIAVLLVVLWLLGMVSAYTLGGFIHVLLLLALVAVVVRVIQRRRPLT